MVTTSTKQWVHGDRFIITPHQKESYMHSDHDIFSGFPCCNDLVPAQHGTQLLHAFPMVMVACPLTESQNSSTKN